MHLYVLLAAASSGGGVDILSKGTRVSVQRCVFTNNTSQWGAALSLYGSPTGKPKLPSWFISSF
jgi:hypothetical protein